MALNTLEASTINRAITLSRRLIEEIQPIADALDIIHNSTGGTSSTITQADLDAAASLSGLTVEQLNDAMNTITNTMRTAINNGYTNLAQLAARSGA